MIRALEPQILTKVNPEFKFPQINNLKPQILKKDFKYATKILTTQILHFRN